ncbi:Mis12 protein-domain-containing protein [Roridomyces roridus]|uniref:Mis12 protein-domain-containing protein n=1 Tax=Roridomyces roridus TaxID=1738132 RepID=A0AAD7B5Z1_9AGAR|nr:Mis12 protein-domain-containing protein [Roridomyces roridus]
MSTEDTPPELVHPLVLTEIVGFSPQLLLDDIINAANHAVQDGVNGLEDFLLQRAEQNGVPEGGEGMQEIEQGLVAFQTLLEFHTDVAFDFFEAWCLRNIFAVPAALPIVMPHHEGLDLTIPTGRERELLDEIEELSNRLEAQWRLRTQLARKNTEMDRTLRSRRTIYKRLAPLEPMLQTGQTLPTRLMEMHESVSTLPELQPTTTAAISQLRHTEAGKRQWEMGKTGYLNWALSQLLSKDGGEQAFPDLALNAEVIRKATAAMDVLSHLEEDVAMDEE